MFFKTALGTAFRGSWCRAFLSLADFGAIFDFLVLRKGALWTNFFKRKLVFELPSYWPRASLAQPWKRWKMKKRRVGWTFVFSCVSFGEMCLHIPIETVQCFRNTYFKNVFEATPETKRNTEGIDSSTFNGPLLSAQKWTFRYPAGWGKASQDRPRRDLRPEVPDNATRSNF